MDWQLVEPQVRKLNNGILGLMEQISSLVTRDRRYPKTSSAFEAAYSQLKNPAYDIVVCGEVKKGKSSLLNAIIGQDILPVDVDVATSQVFRISNSARESFSLVFTDGTTQPITREQLATFGSQVDINQNGVIGFGDRLLSHIQVNIHAQFLPEHVNLVDTPGLGGCYKSHEWITQNYVKKAAAVLFVFDATQPMVELERTFINKILDITPHVMYVMTKIDCVNKTEWEVQKNRIEDGLAVIYKSRNLKAPVLFPMSSKGLMDAAKEEDMDFKVENVRTSLFPAVKDELMSMIVRAVAMSHPSVALYEAQGYVVKVKTVISDLLNAAAANGQELDKQFKESKQAKQKELEKEWGENSLQAQAVSSQISSLCKAVVNNVDQIFRSSSPIREQYNKKVDSISSMEEMKEKGESLPKAMLNDVVQQWDSIMRDALREASCIIQTAISDMDRFAVNSSIGGGGITQLELTTSQKLNNFRTIAGTTMMVTTIATTITAVICPPLAPVVGVITSYIASLFATEATKKDEIQRNKNHMKSELNKLMDKISSELRDARGFKPSVVTEFVDNLKNQSEQVLQDALNSKKQEMKGQLQTLEEQARKDLNQKKQECEQLQAELSEWNKLVQTTNGLETLRGNLERIII